MTLNYPWRAGFEIEVVLGDLRDPRFEEFVGDAMDKASPAYCRAVAKNLTELTNRRWTAPTRAPRQPGFYVLPEYDLDPISFPRQIVAGVELLTPPLPLAEAETVRKELIQAIFELDGYINVADRRVAENCGWHINVDAGPQFLDISKLILSTNELPTLAKNNRLMSPYAARQLHAVGIPMLHHLRLDPSSKLLTHAGLHNFLAPIAGRGKRYAANLAKLDHGYVELRHFSALSFFEGPELEEQLRPLLTGFELPFTEQEDFAPAFIAKFQILRRWLDDVRPDLRIELLKSNLGVAQGTISFDGQPIADVLFDGTAEVNLMSRKQYTYLSQIRDVQLAEAEEALAIAALDAAELMNAGLLAGTSGNPRFQRLISQLAAELTLQC